MPRHFAREEGQHVGWAGSLSDTLRLRPTVCSRRGGARFIALATWSSGKFTLLLPNDSKAKGIVDPGRPYGDSFTVTAALGHYWYEARAAAAAPPL